MNSHEPANARTLAMRMSRAASLGPVPVVEELGAEPTGELRELHQRILTADAALAIAGPARPTAAEPQRDTPRQLPVAVLISLAGAASWQRSPRCCTPLAPTNPGRW